MEEMKKRWLAGDGGARGRRRRVENQYEITLARVSAKLQVIKRADKQMKQREARGAASPPNGEQKEEDVSNSASGREARKRRNATRRELISCGWQNKYSSTSDWKQLMAKKNARKVLIPSSNVHSIKI